MKRILKTVTDVQMWIAMTALTAVILLNAVEIGLRFFLGLSLYWIQDVNLLLMIWMIFPGVAKLVYDKNDIIVDLLVNALPPRIRRSIELACDMLIIVFFAALTYFSIQLLIRQWGNVSAVVRIPLAYYSSAVLVNCVTIFAIYCAELATKFIPAKVATEVKK
jgi:TRAP-type C4-dicarboxylate transport system permease small subunit